jgi:ELWxxDGT repeat protein
LHKNTLPYLQKEHEYRSKNHMKVVQISFFVPLKRAIKSVLLGAILLLAGNKNCFSQIEPYRINIPNLPTKDLNTLHVIKAGTKLYFTSDGKFFSLDVVDGTSSQITPQENINFGPEIAVVGSKIILSSGEPIVYDINSLSFEILKETNSQYQSLPRYFFSHQNYGYFTADDGNGENLWRTDGSPDGTIKLSTDKFLGKVKYTPLGNSLLVMGKSSGTSNNKLYITDGTPENTSLLKDFSLDEEPGSFSIQYEDNYVETDASSVFVIVRASSSEIWYTDGTPENTKTLLTLDRTIAFTNQLEMYEGKLYYNKISYSPGLESYLMRYDFSTEISEEVESFPGKYLLEMHPSNSYLILNLDQDLWVTDGTSDGTTILKMDLTTVNRLENFFSLADGQLIIRGSSSLYGQELWITDGTPEGTSILKDIFPGTANGLPSYQDYDIQVFEDNILYFLADSPEVGFEFWKSDGSTDGTLLIADVNSSTLAEPLLLETADIGNYMVARISDIAESNTFLLDRSSTEFEKINDSNGNGITSLSFAETANAIFFQNIFTGDIHEMTPSGEESIVSPDELIGVQSISNLVVLNEQFIFNGSNSNGVRTFLSDRTPEGTIDLGLFFIQDYSKDFFEPLNDHEVVFSAADPANNDVYGTEPWKLNLISKEASLIKDINPGTGKSHPSNFHSVGDDVYFFAGDEYFFGHHKFLYKTDGTESGTTEVYNFEQGCGRKIFSAGSQAMLLVEDTYNEDNFSLWKTDGTAGSTSPIQSMGHFSGLETSLDPAIQADDYVAFLQSNNGQFTLKAINGSLEETVLLENSGYLKAYWRKDGFLFFINSMRKLFRTDGTAEGTVQIDDYFAKSEFSDLSGYGSFNDLIILNWRHNSQREIWAQPIFNPEIQVESNSTPVLNESYYEFSSVQYETKSVTNYVLSVKNTGLTNLHLSAGIIGANAEDFAINNLATGTKIGPDQQLILEISFTPHAIGPRLAILSLNSNDPNVPTLSIQLSGKGVKANQSIIFESLTNKTFGIEPFILSGLATSGLVVSFESSDESILSIEGNTATVLKSGKVDITANQPGNGNYEVATPVVQTLTIYKVSQTITFESLPTKTYGDAPFELFASANSSLDVTFSSSDPAVASVAGNVLTNLKAGSVTITATQAGNDNYYSATATQTLTINRAAQTISFEPPSYKTFGDPAFQLSASSSTGLPITFASSDPAVVSVEGNSASIVKAGTVTITASQAGTDNYNTASAEQTLTVAKASQTITFDDLPTLQSDDDPIELVAEATSGLPVAFQSLDKTIATMEGATLTITGSGITSITATQGGDENYLAAEDVVRTLVVEEVTGLNELAAQIKVYPNPTESFISIELPGSITQVSYALTLTTGQKVKEGRLTSQQGKVEIPFDGMWAGTYLLTLTNGELSSTWRIIKN